MKTVYFVNINNTSNFNVLFQNLESFNNKQDLMKSFVEEINFQAMCVSESWLSPEKLDLIKLTGYKIASSFCRK